MTTACAPMAAITHAAFRTLLERFGGCDEYYSEMIGAGAFVSGGRYEKWYVLDAPCPEKMVWQIVGSDASRLSEAAAMLSSRKGIGVDINMGCSAPDILRAGSGAAWLDKGLDDVRRMVRAVRAAVKAADKTKRLSVKMRIAGKNSADGWLVDMVKMLCDEGVERIALHARGEKEKYRSRPHWEAVEKAARAANDDVSVAINGDIKDAASLTSALAACPHADCVMIGRQAAVEPWVFAVLKGAMDEAPLSLEVDREQLALDFIALLKQYQPEDFWRTRLKRFFAYYAQGFSFAHYFAAQLSAARNTDEAEARIKDYFLRQPSDKIKKVM